MLLSKPKAKQDIISRWEIARLNSSAILIGTTQSLLSDFSCDNVFKVRLPKKLTTIRQQQKSPSL